MSPRATWLKTQLLGKAEREPHGEFSMPGYGAYQTADQRWIYLLMLSDAHWAKFCQVLGLPADAALATFRQRRKLREQVEDLVKRTVASHAYDDVATRLKSVGFGCTEVLPLERVLEAPQARADGKLRPVRFRGYQFAVPEFPRLHPGQNDVATLPPAELGSDTRALLQSAGIGAAEYAALLQAGGIAEAKPGAFAWAPVRRDG
jgi:crotonobetainyl-CoA:carnitine CoA-transferase CaiB-like acyl-CoA transferase